MRSIVPSRVSHHWFSPRDASLPSFGSRRARFPAVVGTMRALRLPTRASAVAYLVRFRRPRLPPVSCSPRRSRKAGGASRARALRYRLPTFPALVRGREWDLSGLQAIHPVPLLRSWTPVEPMCPRHGGHTDAAPAIRTATASALADFGAGGLTGAASAPAVLRFALRIAARAQGSLQAGRLGLCQEGVERSGSRREVSARVDDHPPLLLS